MIDRFPVDWAVDGQLLVGNITDLLHRCRDLAGLNTLISRRLLSRAQLFARLLLVWRFDLVR